MEKMGIDEKIVNIQNELKVTKDLVNEYGKFNYRSAEMIYEGVKPLCKKYGCALFISDNIELIGDRYYIRATATLTDTTTGAYVHASAMAREAEAQKGMNDAQISGSASSYARKYALGGLFLLDDNKDADHEDFSNKGDTPKKSAKKPVEVPDNPITAEDLKEMQRLDIDIDKLADYLKKSVDKLSHDDAVKAIRTKKAHMEGKK